MGTVAEVTAALETFAPLSLAEEWDSVGLQIGDPKARCQTIAIGLDLTLATLEEAIAAEADLIITHHPLLFSRRLRTIRFDQPIGHLIQRLCEEKISYYTAHTNLDSTHGGLNDSMAEQLQLTDLKSLLPPSSQIPPALAKKVVGLGRVGRLKTPGTLGQLAKQVQEIFQPEDLRIIGHEHQELIQIALCTGSGGSLMREAIASGADCYITGDVKYHQALDAEAAGMAVLDVGHYASELPAIAILHDVLEKAFGNSVQLVQLKSAGDPLRSFVVI